MHYIVYKEGIIDLKIEKFIGRLINITKEMVKMRQLIVTAGVIVRDNRIMLAQRFDDDTEGGKWEFPGGRIEFGEEPRRSLARELKEELDIRVNVKALVDTFSEVKDGIHLIIIYFLCEIIKGTPTPLQCQKVKWFQRDEVDCLVKPTLDENFWINHRDYLLGIVE